MSITLKSPYSYFGSKRLVAPIIWQAFGKVSNYVEPFAGSLSVLLLNPNPSKIETVNDIDHMIANFWRSISYNPEQTAFHADYPIHETELHSRHKWLVSMITDEFKLKMDSDPDFYDTKMAGYWIYGMGASIGNNWLNPKGLKSTPILSSAGGGIHGLSNNIMDWFKGLQERTKRVRVCCGDWKRIMSPSITYNNKGLSPKDITAIFLDPPYNLNGRDKVYNNETNVFSEVLQWCKDNQDNKKLRIAVCGYEGDFDLSEDWEKYSWATNGGMANLGESRGKENAKKEVIYFSPNCLKINEKNKE